MSLVTINPSISTLYIFLSALNTLWNIIPRRRQRDIAFSMSVCPVHLSIWSHNSVTNQWNLMKLYMGIYHHNGLIHDKFCQNGISSA